MSHGDLQHTGLYAYAYSRWGLTAPAYTTLPVQAMARIAATEDVEGVLKATAVEFKHEDVVYHVKVGREVILSAGFVFSS